MSSPSTQDVVGQPVGTGDIENVAAPVVASTVATGDSPMSYGATTLLTEKELPLLMGRYQVAPDQLLRSIVGCYVVFSAFNILADLMYLTTIDGRFPAGLEHLYPSDWERRQTVLYTQQVVTVGMFRKLVTCCLVVSFVYFKVFALVDDFLRWLPTYVGSKCWSLQERVCKGSCCVSCGSFFECCLTMPMQCLQGMSSCFGRCCGCCCSPCIWCFADHDWRELLRGSVYLGLFSTVLFVGTLPFMYATLRIELAFGFANALTVTTADFWRGLSGNLLQMLFFAIPGRFMFLALLKFRLGWLIMWGGVCVIICVSQFNMATLAPMVMQMNNAFPAQTFGVGRGFPTASAASKTTPWVSLNRIYLEDVNASTVGFLTHDKSPGHLALGWNSSLQKWTIAENSTKAIYARTLETAVPHVTKENLLTGLTDETWSLGKEARMGLRSGEELRSKLFGFAKVRNISIAQIYLVDGSHKDARANAFVSGMDGAVIGLYDTLFLGSHPEDAKSLTTPVGQDVADDLSVQGLSNFVQGIDENEDDHRKTWNSSPTLAMNDDEIIAILAHELAHSALHHLEKSMVLQAGTSLLTFATLGWAAHSPLVGAAFMLGAPILHVGACVHDHVIAPTMEGAMKFFSDWMSRYNEYEADAYATRLDDKYGAALQSSLAKLTVNANQDPDVPWWYEAMHFDHPTFANRWAHIELSKQGQPVILKAQPEKHHRP